MRRALASATLLAALVTGLPAIGSSSATPLMAAGPQDEQPIFRSGVQRVTIAASVRTRRGRYVSDLKASDFELYDAGVRRQILDFQHVASPVSIGLLVDFSGSMDVAARRQAAHASAGHLIEWLQAGEDAVGLYVFDRQLREVQAPAPAPGNVLAQLSAIQRPYGVTSLFDAIAHTGQRIAATTLGRRAVVALTDGADNASALTAEEVSFIASGIDVPVYVVIVVSPFDRIGRGVYDEEALDRIMSGPLGNLARWTGGEIYAGIGPAQSNDAARQIVTDLRQQYLIAFEPGPRPGWHPLELRVRNRDLVVRTRGGYMVPPAPKAL